MGKILIEKSGIFTEISGGTQETPQQLLAKILTVDGKGSGLDADLLGGVNYSQYALKKDYYDRNIINTELSKKLNISDYNNEKSTFALKTELSNSNKPVYVVSDTEPTDKNVFWIKDEESPAESIGKSIEDLKKYNDSNYNKIETLQNQIQELKKLLNKQGSGTSGSATASIVSQPRPNLLKNSSFLIGRNIPEKENVAKFGLKYPFLNRYTNSIIGLKCKRWDYICDCWFLYSNDYIRDKDNICIRYNLENETQMERQGFNRVLKITDLKNGYNPIFIVQRLNDYHIDVPNNNVNYGAIVSGYINQTDEHSDDVDLDYKIYIVIKQNGLIFKSEEVKLDKEHIIEGKNGSRTTIKYNILENLPASYSSSLYDAFFVIKLPANAVINENRKLRISNLKLELLQSKDDPKIPTKHTLYGGNYDTDLNACSAESYVLGNDVLYSSEGYENKHQLKIFIPNYMKIINIIGISLTYDMQYKELGGMSFITTVPYTNNGIIFTYDRPFKVANVKLLSYMVEGEYQNLKDLIK